MSKEPINTIKLHLEYTDLNIELKEKLIEVQSIRKKIYHIEKLLK